jgi:hypothetical protein
MAGSTASGGSRSRRTLPRRRRRRRYGRHRLPSVSGVVCGSGLNTCPCSTASAVDAFTPGLAAGTAGCCGRGRARGRGHCGKVGRYRFRALPALLAISPCPRARARRLRRRWVDSGSCYGNDGLMRARARERARERRERRAAPPEVPAVTRRSRSAHAPSLAHARSQTRSCPRPQSNPLRPPAVRPAVAPARSQTRFARQQSAPSPAVRPAFTGTHARTRAPGRVCPTRGRRRRRGP